MSEQHINDCGRENNGGLDIEGCDDGGWPHDYYKWLMYRNRGRAQMEFCSSPYLSKDLPCRDNNNCDFMGAHLRKYHMVEVDNRVEAQGAFRHYEQGVLDDPKCCERPRKTFQKMKIA